MAKTNLGRVSLVPIGEYDSSTNYKKLDVVSYNGSMYICKKDCIGVPTDNEEYWLKAVQKGDTGEQGPMPINGVDYNTEEEKEAFKNEVVENVTKEVEENIVKIEEEAISNFNTNATTKTTSFDNNATKKTNTFDTNAINKITDFNTNATNKTSDFDTNAEEKTNAFNENYEEKMLTFEELENNVKELQTENEILKAQIPTGEVEGSFIHLTDSSNMNCDVSLVGNSQQAVREGYNIVDFSNLKQINTDIVEFSNSSTLKITASKAYAYVEYDITEHFTNNLGETLTFISKSVEQSGTFNVTIGIYYNDGTATKYQWFSLNSAKNKGTYLISEEDASNIAKVTFRIMTNNSDSVIESSATIEEPMLLIGTEEKAYELYGQSPSRKFPSKVESVGEQGSAEVKINNKNLYNVNDINRIDNDFVTVDENDWITITCDNSEGTSILWKNIWANKMNLQKSKQYAIVIEIAKVTGTGTLYPVTSDPETQFSERGYYALSSLESNTKKILKKITKDTFDNVIYGLKSFISFDVGESGSITFRLSVLEDISITEDTFEYEQSQSQIVLVPVQEEMHKVGSRNDFFDKPDGKWHEKHIIKKYTLNGTEEWYINNNEYFVLYNIKSAVGSLITSTHFEFIQAWNNVERNAFVYLTTFYIAMANFDFTTVDEFKAWLAEQYEAGTPVEFYYALSTPNLIPCTPEQEQILNNIKTYKNTSTISVDGIGSLKVVYKKDLETLYKNQETRVLALENATLNLAEGG